jgi:Rrf2 family cysteine metabolism transcriptional repressor
MRISNKGLYALEAMLRLARDYKSGPTKIHDIAVSEKIPEKFLELILLNLKAVRLVESLRGVKGGYRLKRPPSKIFLGEIIRSIDGPLAPLGDAESLRRLVKRDKRHSALYQVFLDVRNAAAGILDHTSLADLVEDGRARRAQPKG